VQEAKEAKKDLKKIHDQTRTAEANKQNKQACNSAKEKVPRSKELA
jgi:hypothetical protein